MLTDPRIDAVMKQLETLSILFSRPVIQRQILAIGLIIVLAWLVGKLIVAWVHPWLSRRLNARLAKMQSSRLYRLLRVGKHLYFPMIGLGLVPLAVWLFGLWHYPAGLIQNSAKIFWIILSYKVILALLDIWISERRVQIIRSRILLPLFILIPSVVFLDQFIDINSILAIELFQVLGAQITLGQILMAAIWFYIFTVLSWLVVDGLKNVILPRTQANSGVINSVTTISRYFIIVIGILVVFGTLGVDLTSLALIGTGLTVGIGFGLQQVIGNFISGILLLFEQSLRPGDLIEINKQVGTVQQLNIRSTVIRTVDSEIIVPNQTFLTSQLTTYTKSNLQARVAVPVSVKNSSDPQQVRQILVETAVQHDLVLAEPPPKVFFDGFGGSNINLTLVAWIDDPKLRRSVESDLNFMVWGALSKHGVEVP